MGFCLSNCPTHKGKNYLFPQIQTHKTETKRTIKIKKTPKLVFKTKTKKERNNIQIYFLKLQKMKMRN
jgi:hypothetical protein